MHRLKEAYGDQIDFFVLDVDDATTEEVRLQYGLRNRSHYVLIDPEGKPIRLWAGHLNEEAVFAEL
ncbi:MAG: hypothetical protein AAF485_13470, partial [Chloroflexota bacterium]